MLKTYTVKLELGRKVKIMATSKGVAKQIAKHVTSFEQKFVVKGK